MVKHFFDPKTRRKVRFVYPDNPKSRKIMEEVFDMDKLESRFGGKNSGGFNYEDYALRLREDDKKMSNFADSGCSSPTTLQLVMAESLQPESPASENGCEDESSWDEAERSNVEKEYESIQGQSPRSQDDTGRWSKNAQVLQANC